MPRKKKIKKKTKISKTKKRKQKVVFKKLTEQNAYKSNTFKTNEEKIKIKKIGKQPTEKRIYNIKNHGFIIMPKYRSIDINDLSEIKIAESLLKKK